MIYNWTLLNMLGDNIIDTLIPALALRIIAIKLSLQKLNGSITILPGNRMTLYFVLFSLLPTHPGFSVA